MARHTSKGLNLFSKIYGFSRDREVDLMHSDQIIGICSLLARHAKTLHNLAIVQCNGFPLWFTTKDETVMRQQYGHDWVARYQRMVVETASHQENVVRKRVAVLAVELHVFAPYITGVEFGGDPRGTPFVLITKDGRGDAWAGNGIVPR